MDYSDPKFELHTKFELQQLDFCKLLPAPRKNEASEAAAHAAARLGWWVQLSMLLNLVIDSKTCQIKKKRHSLYPIGFNFLRVYAYCSRISLSFFELDSYVIF
jgi:hypothetical protein